MFTDLAVIDWIALVIAAVLLAAACAAAVIAFATSSSRKNRVGRTKSKSSDSEESITIESPVPPRVPVAEPPTSRVYTPNHRETVTVPDDDSDAARKLADRAARLRGRPVPEFAAPHEVVAPHERQVLEHALRVQNVAVASSAAHAKHSGSLRANVGPVEGIYDRAKGFKPRKPGFFEDPMGRHELRYWDGHTWTEYVKESGERFTDPL